MHNCCPLETYTYGQWVCNMWHVVYSGTKWDMHIKPVKARTKLHMEHISYTSKMKIIFLESVL